MSDVDSDLGGLDADIEGEPDDESGPDQDHLAVRIELGLRAADSPSLQQLLKRCRQRIKLVVGNRRELAHLTDESTLWRSRVEVDKGMLSLMVPMQSLAQPDLLGYSRGRARAAALRAADEAEEQLISKTAAGLESNASVLKKVASILSNSPDPRGELLGLEKSEGVQTKPFRRFLNSKQETFLVGLVDRAIPFERVRIRRSQQVGEGVAATVKLMGDTRLVTVMSCRPEEVSGGDGAAGLSAGTQQRLRFEEVQGWPIVVLTAAREFGWPVQVDAMERIGTCSLKNVPADVTTVKNLRQLGLATAVLLQEVLAHDNQASANDPTASLPPVGATGTAGRVG